MDLIVYDILLNSNYLCILSWHNSLNKCLIVYVNHTLLGFSLKLYYLSAFKSSNNDNIFYFLICDTNIFWKNRFCNCINYYL